MTTFEFYERNKIRLTSQLSVTSNATNSDKLIDRRPDIQYTTSGENSDVNTATIAFHPGSSTNCTVVLLQNHNYKDFKITYNSGTSLNPAFAVTGNAASNTMFIFATQAVTNLEVHCDKTFVTNAEKVCGQFIVSNKIVTFDTNPNARGYKPMLYKKGVDLETSDGGYVSVYLSQKFRARLDFSFISSQTYDSLTAIYDNHKDFIFTPFPVQTFTTEWNGQAYPVNWVGDFDLMNFTDNTLNGYSGRISINQIPN